MKAYSVGTNAAGDLVITGYGVDASTGNSRAFLMTVPKSIAAVGFPLQSPPQIKVVISGAWPAGFTLSFPGVFGTTNYVECTTNLAPPATWTQISSNVGTGATISVPDSSPPDPQRFYRVRITY